MNPRGQKERLFLTCVDGKFRLDAACLEPNLAFKNFSQLTRKLGGSPRQAHETVIHAKENIVCLLEKLINFHFD